jgi:hypothetical protein
MVIQEIVDLLLREIKENLKEGNEDVREKGEQYLGIIHDTVERQINSITNHCQTLHICGIIINNESH